MPQRRRAELSSAIEIQPAPFAWGESSHRKRLAYVGESSKAGAALQGISATKHRLRVWSGGGVG